MARRALIIGGICLGVILLINIFVLTIYLPRLIKGPAATQATGAPAAATPVTASPAATGPSPAKHVAKAEGDIVQRSEMSPSGNIRVKYTRRKGGPVRQIILESATPGSTDPKVLFEHQRNAWVVISPNDEWIALNNRPKAGESHLQLYHQNRASTLDYGVAQDIAVDGLPLEDALWNYYVEAMGLPANTPREAVTMDAVRWENDSTVTISVAVTPLADDDKVPPAWTCTFNVETKQIDTSEETAQAVALQEGQQPGDAGNPFAGAPADDNVLKGDFPGERFPATRLRLLEENEVATWPGENIRYAINELYARRGYDFSDKADQRRLFAKMTWYRPRPGSMTEIEKDLTPVEKQNVDLLAKFRSAKQPERRQTKTSHPQRSGTPGPGEQFWRAFKDGWTGGHPPSP